MPVYRFAGWFPNTSVCTDTEIVVHEKAGPDGVMKWCIFSNPVQQVYSNEVRVLVPFRDADWVIGCHFMILDDGDLLAFSRSGRYLLKDTTADMKAAFVMADHARLGKESAARVLDPELFQLVCRFV
jgi:hypothetical protein